MSRSVKDSTAPQYSQAVEPKKDEIPGFSNRQDISGAIHSRAPVSVDKHVRARKVIAAYPSLKDRIRHHLAEGASTPGKKKEIIEDLICAIGDPFKNIDSGDNLDVSESDVYVKAKNNLADSIAKSNNIKTEDYVGFASAGFESFSSFAESAGFNITESDRTKDMLKHNPQQCPLRMRVRREQFSHNHSLQVIEDLVMPKQEEDDRYEAARRTFQKFPLDALTSLAEMIAPTPPSAGKCNCESTLLCKREAAPKHEDTDQVCRRGLQEGSDGTRERQRIYRELTEVEVDPDQPPGGWFCCADFWVIPVADFIELIQKDASAPTRIKPDKAKAALIEYAYASAHGQVMHQPKRLKKWLQRPALRRPSLMRMNPAMHEVARETLKSVSAHLRNWFDIRDDTDDDPREDFVFSFVSDGRAILAADLRPFPNPGDKLRFTDYQSRIVLIDLAMFREERGRILQRLMDVEAFRHLGLRGHPYAAGAFNAVTALGVALTRITGGHSSPGKKELANELKGIDILSHSLDMLNQFFTYGINGKADSTQAYSDQIRKNLRLFRESRIPGHQTLSGYMERYFTAAHEIELLRSRYNNLRSRLIGATNLLNAQFNQRQLQALATSSGRMLVLTIVTALVATVGLGTSVSNWDVREHLLTALKALPQEIAREIWEAGPGMSDNTGPNEPAATPTRDAPQGS